MAHGIRGGKHGKAQLLIQGGRKDGPLHRPGRHRRREEKALIQGLGETQAGSHLLPQAGSAQAKGGLLHIFFLSDNVAAAGGQPAAGILDQGADTEVRPHIGWFGDFRKLSIAVIHHADDPWFYFFDKGNQLSDF